MQLSKLNARGFTHYVIPIALVTVAVIGGAFFLVLKTNHNSSSKSNLTAPSAQNKTSLGSSEKSQSELSTAASASNTSTASPTPSSKSTTSSTNNSTSDHPTTTPAPSPPPSQTPLSVLTTLITNLDNGAQVNITASAVSVPGPISTAQARPIVFTANGQVYFAYHQGSAANFTTTPSQTANSMAIVNATVNNPSLVQAHLDKSSNLVDPNISSYLVGYSTGGN